MIDLLENLTPSQIEAVTHLDGPCLVVAGAGTGKTTVITRRIAYLVQKAEVSPEEIVALTFTDKAAREMEGRVDELLPYGATGTTISTFHSYCADLLKRHAFLIGLDPASKLLTSADEISFLRQHLLELPTKLLKPSKNPNEFLRTIAQFNSKLKDEHITPTQFASYAALKKAEGITEAEIEQAELYLELSHLYTATQQLYLDNSVLSYGDLLYYAVEILSTFPSARKAEQKRARYLLIDEFQDTNFVQSEIARLLAQEGGNIMVVGDDDQAIYSFRGATLSNILNFTTTFTNCRIITLLDNFRSTQPILDTAYKIIQNNNPVRLEVQENISKKLVSHLEGAQQPEHWHFGRSVFEYRAIAEKIQAILEEGRLQPQDIAILVRSRNHARGIETTLESLGIPHHMYGDSKFYQQTAILISLAFLRFLTNPFNDLNLFFLLSSPPFSVGTQQLQRISKDAHYQKTSLYDQLLTEIEESDTTLKESLSYLQKELQEKDTGLAPIYTRFLYNSGWYRQLAEVDDQTTLELVATLYQELIAYETTHRPSSLATYISHIDYLLATDEDISLQQASEIDPNGVQIMTLHKSKGLEFPVVFIPNIVEGRFPGRNYSDSLPFPYELSQSGAPSRESFIQEERRLAYVGFTRAKEQLYLTSSEMYDDRKTKAKVSLFVREALGEQGEKQTHDEVSSSVPEPVPTILTQSKPAYLPTTFSPSALDTYNDCPLHYQYQYVWNIHVPASHLINFGNSVHETLLAWFEARRDGENPDLEELYRQHWIKGGYENKQFEQERYDQGLIQLRAYVQGPAGNCTPTALEQSIKVTLPDGNILSGKIDRIDQLENGKFRVVDYKTGERAKKVKDMLSDIPLVSYVLSLQQQGKEVDTVELHYVMTGEQVSAPADSLHIEAATRQAAETITEIHTSLQNNHFPAKPDKIKCSYCDYQAICPFRYGSK